MKAARSSYTQSRFHQATRGFTIEDDFCRVPNAEHQKSHDIEMEVK